MSPCTKEFKIAIDQDKENIPPSGDLSISYEKENHYKNTRKKPSQGSLVTKRKPLGDVQQENKTECLSGIEEKLEKLSLGKVGDEAYDKTPSFVYLDTQLASSSSQQHTPLSSSAKTKPNTNKPQRPRNPLASKTNKNKSRMVMMR